MAKPIALLQLPLTLGNGKMTEWRDCREIQETMESKMPDYYWLVIPNHTIETIDFKVYFEKDFTEIQYEELKQLIEKSLPK